MKALTPVDHLLSKIDQKEFETPAEVLKLFNGCINPQSELTVGGEILAQDHFTADPNFLSQILWIMPEIVAPGFHKKDKTYPFGIAKNFAVETIVDFLKKWEAETREWITLTDIFDHDAQLRCCVFFLTDSGKS